VNPSRAHVLRQRIRHTTWVLLTIWGLVSFAWLPFARELNFSFFTWKFNFWMAAQGSVLVFLLLTVVNAWLLNRWEQELTTLEELVDSPVA
jgi:putative solute:sodium symporter small subunit